MVYKVYCVRNDDENYALLVLVTNNYEKALRCAKKISNIYHGEITAGDVGIEEKTIFKGGNAVVKD